MIVVLADDLTGAAELAGTAWKRGLTAEVQMDFSPETSAQVVCVDTDTRSLPKTEAFQAVHQIATKVGAATPAHLYKKCDSVLRGNVLAEMRAIMAATGREQATLVSANPSRGRIIFQGEYSIHGKPLAETGFAHDPEYPRLTSRVKELLGGDLAGVAVPDAGSPADLLLHARCVTPNTLAAGGVEFFEALLDAGWAKGDSAARVAKARETARTLFVCGSAAAWGNGRAAQCAERGVPLVPMPDILLTGESDEAAMDAWVAQLGGAFSENNRTVMAAVGRPVMPTSFPASLLASRLAEAVSRVLRRTRIDRVCAEGGATAAALARVMGWNRFAVTAELAGGVVELEPVKAPNMALVIKVGSYDWPGAVW